MRIHASGLLFACAAGVLVPGGCGGRLLDQDRLDRSTASRNVAALRVTVGNAARGSATARLAYSARGVTFPVRVEAQTTAGRVVSDFEGWFTLSVRPGVLLRIDGPTGVVAGRSVRATHGVVEGIQLTVARAYGETRIWAEEEGYVPASPDASPACANGLDDDGDGRADFPADYGCAAPNDNDERAGSYAAAASEAIFFEEPSIADVQGLGDTTPLAGERVTVDRGTLIVTRTGVSGFWVTDIADRSCAVNNDPSQRYACFNSIFVFNFSLPAGMRPCDRLATLQGTVQEFVSTTQLGQPSWTYTPDGRWIDEANSGACPIPAATAIQPAQLSDANGNFEPLESSLVRASNAVLSRNVGPARVTCTADGVCDFAPGRSSCDQNGDAKIDFNDTAEALCANTCQTTPSCSEWLGWRQYGQVAFDFASGQSRGVQRMIVALRDALPDFDPQRDDARTQQPATFTGTLKQVGPNWIIEPRCEQDVAFTGQTVLDTNRSCVFPRSLNEEP